MQILFAQGGVTELFPWPPNTLWEAALACVVFGLIGIGLAVLGFKIFDLVTPGNLEEEIVKKNNMAAAIITGAFIIGVCIIIARVVGS
jgi:putative membrane protein